MLKKEAYLHLSVCFNRSPREDGGPFTYSLHLGTSSGTCAIFKYDCRNPFPPDPWILPLTLIWGLLSVFNGELIANNLTLKKRKSHSRNSTLRISHSRRDLTLQYTIPAGHCSVVWACFFSFPGDLQLICGGSELVIVGALMMETLVVVAQHRNQYHSGVKFHGPANRVGSSPFRKFTEINCRNFESGPVEIFDPTKIVTSELGEEFGRLFSAQSS
ncbi:uncharacterized protein LOC119991422 [Tripterygium wilfordii]|uniref:uncharacterized protein LOC119991422 n=1 Tax=Tripterygium wilfordii TaxID=458696 RepID=UPI0018F7F356|nr:uncharacterized protein LOC119991422 [Tripterygium wilfordii]